MQIILLALIGSFVNCFIRGGLVNTVILNPYKSSKIVLKLIALGLVHVDPLNGTLSLNFTREYNAILYGLVCSFYYSPIICLLAALGMLVGSLPGWGSYIGAMLGNPPHTRLWGVMMMTLRGMFWCLCLFVPVFYLTHQLNQFMLVPFCSMGIVYMSTILFFQALPKLSGEVINHWTTAEIIYGPLLWLPLAFYSVA